MDDDLQWAVEEVEHDAGIAPTIIDDDSTCDANAQKPTISDAQKLKKRQRLEKMKAASKRHRQEKQLQHSVMHGIELRDAAEQARAFRSLFPEQSDLEAVQAADFVAVDQHDLDQLPAAIRQLQPAWKEKLLGKDGLTAAGGPVLLVLTYSATRAVQIIRALRAFQTPQRPIAKLFAKHLKIDDQIAALEADIRVAVGTPNRVLKLFDAGALSSNRLEHVVIDMGLDAKNFNLFDIHAVRDDFVALFGKYLESGLKSRSGRFRICLY